MKFFTIFFSFVFLTINTASAEVVLRDGLISPDGVKTGVRVACNNEEMENSLLRWYSDYNRLFSDSNDALNLKVSLNTLPSGLVSIRLSGHSNDVEYALQPAAGCGVSSYIEPI